MYTVVKSNEQSIQLHQNIISGAPSSWDEVSRHRLLRQAKDAARQLAKHARCQVRDDDGSILFWGCDLG